MNPTIEIYDPAMCCSTGVCGTEIDDTLVDFANDLKWLKSRSVEVRRYNLGQEPEAFKSNLIQKLKLTVVIGDIAEMSAQFQEGKDHGIELPDLNQALQAGLNDRQEVTQQLVQTANELLGVLHNGCTPRGGCC